MHVSYLETSETPEEFYTNTPQMHDGRCGRSVRSFCCWRHRDNLCLEEEDVPPPSVTDVIRGRIKLWRRLTDRCGGVMF